MINDTTNLLILFMVMNICMSLVFIIRFYYYFMYNINGFIEKKMTIVADNYIENMNNVLDSQLYIEMNDWLEFNYIVLGAIICFFYIDWIATEIFVQRANVNIVVEEVVNEIIPNWENFCFWEPLYYNLDFRLLKLLWIINIIKIILKRKTKFKK